MSGAVVDGSQADVAIRFDWALSGARAITDGATCAVVVDVLSFTTTLSVALDAGMTVWPCAFGSERAAHLAAANDAVLAVARSTAGPGDISLSAGTLRAASGTRRLVLTSPNGSAVAEALSERAQVLGASLRNAAAVAAWIADAHDPDGAIVAVVAAGERWADGSLRPAAEDLWGAGAVIDALLRRGWTSLSPEARVAAAAFAAVRADIGPQLAATVSGRELVGTGFGADVAIAAELDQSSVVPLLSHGRFVDAAAFVGDDRAGDAPAAVSLLTDGPAARLAKRSRMREWWSRSIG